MSAWESTLTPSLRKSVSRSIIALRNNSESPILSSSATVHPPSVDWSLQKEPHGGRLRQRPLPFTHSRGHYRFRRRGTSFEAVYRCARFHGLLCVSHLRLNSLAFQLLLASATKLLHPRFFSGVLGPQTNWRGRPGVAVEADLTCNHVVA